ncbi:Uncharacterised protein [Burkholderia pseudomallei]|nr:Uncharacterised protein [Burkholderia pseudomallei]
MDNRQPSDTRGSRFIVRAINEHNRLFQTLSHTVGHSTFVTDRSVFNHPPFLASFVKVRVDTSLPADGFPAFERQRPTP